MTAPNFSDAPELVGVQIRSNMIDRESDALLSGVGGHGGDSVTPSFFKPKLGPWLR